MAEQLLNRLINAVENIRSANNGTGTNQNRERNESVESEINHLFPSVASVRQNNQSSLSQSSVTTSRLDADPDRVARTNTFNPTQNYRASKSRKKQSSNRSQKRKRDECEKGNSSKSAILKDVIMLPSPDIKVVPRGWKREKLYEKMFAVSAVEIHESMSEGDVRQIFNNIYEKKIAGLSEPKFNFVRAVGNKIIDPGCKSYDGKVIKYLSKQGPIYIRATQNISSGLQILNENEHTSDESNSDDNGEEQSVAGPSPRPHDEAHTEGDGIEEADENSDDDVLFVSAFGSNDDAPVLMNETFPVILVNCPTCTMSFPSDEIAEHADRCADAAEGLLQSQVTYGSLMMQEMDIPEVVFESSSNDGSATTIVECLATLRRNVKEEITKIYVRRKRLWEDFVHVTKSCKWFQPQNNIKVTFIGEPAIDDGGPKREFFTETLDQMKIRLFCNGVPVASTISLTEGLFKAAGLLMACSIVQGGPAPNFMSPWVYDYLAFGLHHVPLNPDDIEDISVKNVADQISNASSDQELQETLCKDEILMVLSSVGYRGIPSRESLANKDKLVRSICVKELLAPRIPVLKDLEEGLQHFDLLCSMKNHPALFKQVFTPSSIYEISAHTFLDGLLVMYSAQQALKEKEEDIFKYFTDFILTLEHGGIDEAPDLSLRHVVKFVTGTYQMPAIGFPSRIKIKFLHGCAVGCKCRPVSSTCYLTLTLPVHLCRSEELGDLLISALTECCGFDKV